MNQTRKVFVLGAARNASSELQDKIIALNAIRDSHLRELETQGISPLILEVAAAYSNPEDYAKQFVRDLETDGEGPEEK